jgi:hypothetical protein
VALLLSLIHFEVMILSVTGVPSLLLMLSRSMGHSLVIVALVLDDSLVYLVTLIQSGSLVKVGTLMHPGSLF